LDDPGTVRDVAPLSILCQATCHAIAILPEMSLLATLYGIAISSPTSNWNVDYGVVQCEVDKDDNKCVFVSLIAYRSTEALCRGFWVRMVLKTRARCHVGP
jgi:hypothetical protein